MSSPTLTSLDGRLVEAIPVHLALRPVAAFTSFIVEQRGVRGWSLHEARLASATRDLWGHDLNPWELRSAITQHLSAASSTPISMRVTAYPRSFDLASPEAAAGVSILVVSKEAPSHHPKRVAFSVASIDYERYLPHLKTTDLFRQIQIRRHVRQDGFDDALLVSSGRVLEGITWTVLAWTGGEVATPGGAVLSSVTAALYADVAATLGGHFTQRDISLPELYSADLVLAINVNNPVRSISHLDSRPLNAKPALVEELRTAYNAIPFEFPFD